MSSDYKPEYFIHPYEPRPVGETKPSVVESIGGFVRRHLDLGGNNNNANRRAGITTLVAAGLLSLGATGVALAAPETSCETVPITHLGDTPAEQASKATFRLGEYEFIDFSDVLEDAQDDGKLEFCYSEEVVDTIEDKLSDR